MNPETTTQKRLARSGRRDDGLSGLTITAMSEYTRRHNASCFVVGGFVRDLVENKPSSDIDVVVTGMEPLRLAEHLHHRLGFSKPVVYRRFMTVLVARSGLNTLR